MKISVRNLLREVFDDDHLCQMDQDVLARNIQLTEVKSIDKMIVDLNARSLRPKKAGSSRIDDWETGWSGRGIFSESGEFDNLPYYFAKNKYVRVGTRYFEDVSGFTEVFLLRALQSLMVKMAISLTGVSSLMEYGAGTGSNLQYLSKLFPQLSIYCSDWTKASCDNVISRAIVKPKNVWRVNYFESDTFKGPSVNYIAFTNASLEQAGDSFREFVDFLVDDPNCVAGIHIEPMRDLLDLSSKLNWQSYVYAMKRGYLFGLPDYIKSKNVKVHYCHDHGVGSEFINGYQTLLWSNETSK